MTVEWFAKDETAIHALAGRLATNSYLLSEGITFYLSGELGAGKTSFTRGFLTALGYVGTVKSPTYTLVETYVVKARTVYHFDLYRIYKAAELWQIGIAEYFQDNAFRLIEWPERGAGILPAADLQCNFYFESIGRRIVLHAITPLGLTLLDKL